MEKERLVQGRQFNTPSVRKAQNRFSAVDVVEHEIVVLVGNRIKYISMQALISGENLFESMGDYAFPESAHILYFGKVTFSGKQYPIAICQENIFICFNHFQYVQTIVYNADFERARIISVIDNNVFCVIEEELYVYHLSLSKAQCGYNKEFVLREELLGNASLIRKAHDGNLIIGMNTGDVCFVDIQRKIFNRNYLSNHLCNHKIQDISVIDQTLYVVSRDAQLLYCTYADFKLFLRTIITVDLTHYGNCCHLFDEYIIVGLANGYIQVLSKNMDTLVSKRISFDSIKHIERIPIDNGYYFFCLDDLGVATIVSYDTLSNRIYIKERSEVVNTIRCSCAMNGSLVLGYLNGMVECIQSINGVYEAMVLLQPDVNYERSIRSIACFDDVLILGCDDGRAIFFKVKEYDLSELTQMNNGVQFNQSIIYSIAYDRDDKLLFFGRHNGQIDCYYCDFGEIAIAHKWTRTDIHKAVVGQILVEEYHGEKRLLTCSDDRTMRVNTITATGIIIGENIFKGYDNAELNRMVVCNEFIYVSCDDGSIYEVLDEDGDGYPENIRRITCAVGERNIRPINRAKDYIVCGSKSGNLYKYNLRMEELSAVMIHSSKSKLLYQEIIDDEAFCVYEDYIFEYDIDGSFEDNSVVLIVHSEETKDFANMLSDFLAQDDVKTVAINGACSSWDTIIQYQNTAVYAFCILSEEIAYTNKRDSDSKLHFRCDSNTLVLIGYFWEALQHRMSLIKIGHPDSPSDLEGIVPITISKDSSDSIIWKRRIKKELSNANIRIRREF